MEEKHTCSSSMNCLFPYSHYLFYSNGCKRKVKERRLGMRPVALYSCPHLHPHPLASHLPLFLLLLLLLLVVVLLVHLIHLHILILLQCPAC